MYAGCGHVQHIEKNTLCNVVDGDHVLCVLVCVLHVHMVCIYVYTVEHTVACGHTIIHTYSYTSGNSHSCTNQSFGVYMNACISVCML